MDSVLKLTQWLSAGVQQIILVIYPFTQMGDKTIHLGRFAEGKIAIDKWKVCGLGIYCGIQLQNDTSQVSQTSLSCQSSN